MAEIVYGGETCLRLRPVPVCSCLQKCYKCNRTGLCNEMHLVTDNFLGKDGGLLKVFLCEACHRKHISDICDR
jgi:hypothetical protein